MLILNNIYLWYIALFVGFFLTAISFKYMLLEKYPIFFFFSLFLFVGTLVSLIMVPSHKENYFISSKYETLKITDDIVILYIKNTELSKHYIRIIEDKETLENFKQNKKILFMKGVSEFGISFVYEELFISDSLYTALKKQGLKEL